MTPLCEKVLTLQKPVQMLKKKLKNVNPRKKIKRKSRNFMKLG